jgi:cyanophycinase-like exopeptidase
MGSGETAPTMVKVHRAVFERTGDGPAVLLDTPYGFQTNAAELTRRTCGYFADSVGQRVEPVDWPRDPGPGADRERALARLRDARWVFAGPGSPTYALRQWRDTPLPGAVAATLAEQGTVVFASAAALTLGAFTVPVYEIYKAGEEPHWERGLDLMGTVVGLPAVVIPHYNNAEGGTHDTRYCYLGEQRLAAMEGDLPEDAFVLGVDEHTACLLDLDTRTAEVLGTGVVTVRRHGRSRTYPSGTTLCLADLLAAATAAAEPAEAEPPSAPGAAPGTEPPGPQHLNLVADAEEAQFRAHLAAGEADAVVAAILRLDQILEDWSADPSDERDYARSVLRGMVVQLGERARTGLADPRERIAPYVEALLELRERARQGRDFGAADLIRDRLVAAGVEVRDTPDGPQWLPAQPAPDGSPG